MIRKLLTTTALLAVMQGGAYAADNNPSVPVFSDDIKYESRVDEQGYYESSEGQILANTLIGKTIYNHTGEEAEAIGDVNDIVISPNGKAEALIIGVGGFLGIGEKDVAVQFDRIHWTEKDGERWIIVEATKEELEAAPEYDRSVLMKTSATENSGQQMEEQTAQKTDEEPAQDGTGMTVTGTTQVPAAEEADRSSSTMQALSDSRPGRENLQPVDVAEVSAEELIGAPIYGEDDVHVGEISDVIVSDAGKVEEVVADVGGFLGIGEKRVAVEPENVDFMKQMDGELVVFTTFTKEQLEAEEAYSKASVGTSGGTTEMNEPKS